MKKIILFAAILLLIGFVSAAECPKLDIKTVDDAVSRISEISSNLQSCSPDVSGQLKRLITNGIFLIDVTDKTKFYVRIKNGTVAGVSLSGDKYDYKTSMSECVANNILSKENKMGAFSAYYLGGKANLGASGLINKVKLWFGKLFAGEAFKSAQIPVESCENATIKDTSAAKNKPTNCYETYMEGHKEYRYGKAEWDRRKAETKGVCQTATSEAPKGGKCEYLFEQIEPTTGDKKWLCWYN